ncbi:hypothetical protein EC844_106128 [Acinetobacter calcoaceticus]|uniref:histidine kinase n=1 Tax=Acinetobacter calcoaceticus TaxID=471 RepID=A0A4R1Y089_ACICA|nr:hypothetical protein EC844_106128 [Acinetobacter calcoaceticus]
MALKVIGIGQADQLSTCKVSLLLGVFTTQNLIDDFLLMTRRLMQAHTALMFVQDEPYIWQNTERGFEAFQPTELMQLHGFFKQSNMLYSDQQQGQLLSKCMTNAGFEHQHFIAFDLKMASGQSFAQLILLDGAGLANQGLNYQQLIDDLTKGLMRNLELRREYDALKELYDQQCALNFSKTKFFQIIAHDLRAPFHGLLGFSGILAEERESLDDEGIQNIAEYLHDTTQSTYSLLENLLNWAMAEGGRLVIHPVEFSLKQSSKIVYDVLNSLALKKNISLFENIDPALKVYADINMVTSVIQNLVSNALKFTPLDGTGKVFISAKQLLGTVEICVRDTGLGMTKSQLRDIFQPDINISLKGTSGEKGTGLGLVLCRRFIDLNHGQMQVTSKLGQGTTVKVILPSTASGSQRSLRSTSTLAFSGIPKNKT